METNNWTKIPTEEFKNSLAKNGLKKTTSADFGKVYFEFYSDVQIISFSYGLKETFMNALDFFIPMSILYLRKAKIEILEIGGIMFQKNDNVIIIRKKNADTGIKTKEPSLKLESSNLGKLIHFSSHFIFSTITKTYPFNCDSSSRNVLLQSFKILKDIVHEGDFSSELFFQLQECFCIIQQSEYSKTILDNFPQYKIWAYEIEIIPMIILGTITTSICEEFQKLNQAKILQIKQKYGFKPRKNMKI